MENDYIDTKGMISYSEGGIISKEIMKNGKNGVTLFCMAAGTEIEDHTSTKEGIVYVIEGNGIFNLEGKDIAMKPGVIIYMQKNAVHSLKAKENTSFVLYLH